MNPSETRSSRDPHIRIDTRILEQITNVRQERNIYTHPNALARDIFWQRLECLYRYLITYTTPEQSVLDLGGGSGVFAPAVSRIFEQVDIVDLDTICAENIKKFFHLDNVIIHKGDIGKFMPSRKFDLVIAADVLEHFSDLSVPVSFIRRVMSSKGRLFVSLPTENWLYELGRVVVRKTKPADHYHDSRCVLDALSRNGFTLTARSFCPRYVLPIPLFEVAALECGR